MLAYSNDVGYDVVFKEQRENFVEKDDVVIGIKW
jgi:phosphoheptose isomerase